MKFYVGQGVRVLATGYTGDVVGLSLDASNNYLYLVNYCVGGEVYEGRYYLAAELESL